MAVKHTLVFVTICSIWATRQTGAKSDLIKTPGITQHVCEKGPLDDTLVIQCADGYAYRCNNTGLKKVPSTFPKHNGSSRMCLLDLSTNKLTRLDNYSFTEVTDILWLYLFDNRINRIDSDAFVNLTNLLNINLTSNLLHIPDSFGKDVFSPLINLRYINLKNNRIGSYHGLQTLLYPLKNLQSLYISGCYNCIFEKGFENLTNLRNISLSGTEPKMCNINVLLSNTFNHLPQITNLYLSSCNINVVEGLAFKPLKNIQRLDISYNENLHFEGMKNVLEGLANSSIKTLNFDRIYEFYERGTSLKKKYIELIKYLKNLTSLHLDLNKIEVIEKEAFDLLPNKTTHIVLSGNRLTYGQYVQYLVRLKHVTFLDISRQHLNYDPFLHDHYEHPLGQMSSISRQGDSSLGVSFGSENTKLFSTLSNNPNPIDACSKCMEYCRVSDLTCVCIPPQLKDIKWKMSFLRFHVRSFNICPPSSLRTLDVSFNLILEWTGPLFGLEKLTELNLAENYCKNMSSQFFDHFYSLRKLNISYNFLGPILIPTNKDTGQHFNKLTNLENLDLSENRITSLSVDIFQHLERLKYLNVSRNMLSHWKSSLRTNCLQLIDLSGNRFESLPEHLREYLDGIADMGPDKSCNRKQKVVVDLTNNPIQCNCESKSFLKWLSKTNVNVKFSETDDCVFDGHTVQLNDRSDIAEFVKHLDRVCFPFISVIISSCICFLSTVLCFAVYRNRWKLRHLYYSKRKRHHHKGYDRLFEKDAFISYAKPEASFMKNKLVPALEGESCDLKVWVADRDSRAGASVAENITHAVNNCRKSVLFLSKNYFRDNWCNYEMNMARIESIESNRKLLIIVLYNDVAVKEIPLEYLRLLKSEQSLDYPSHPQDLDTFWTSLAEAIQTE